MNGLDKYQGLVSYLRPLGRVIVAFSGGLDSTLLLKAAVDAGLKVLAVTGDSPSLPPWDRDSAVNIAKALKVRHLIVKTDEMDISGYRENSPDRCFYCKDNLFKKLRTIAEKEGIETILDGTNADDLSDTRPGIRAAKKHGIKSPLAELGITKRDVREMLKDLGFDYRRPASACLASRLPYWKEVSEEALEMIAKAETFLRELGFSDCRVRHFWPLAVVELPEEELPKTMEQDLRERIVKTLMEIGYPYVCLDLEGLKSGKMNRLLWIQGQGETS